VPTAPPTPTQAAAAALAEQLEPLSEALHEIATSITRHCARTGGDAELARMVEAVRERAHHLWGAVYRLAEAARSRAPCPSPAPTARCAAGAIPGAWYASRRCGE
jgi:hypothetical protein